MVKIATVAAGALAFAASAAAQATLNTPASITQCQPAALSWSGATGTVRLIILPAGEVSATPIETLPEQSGSSGTYVWTVNLEAGRNITISINDDSGSPNYASPLVVMDSSQTSCLNAAASGSSSTSASSTGSMSSASSTSMRSSSSAASATSSAMSSMSSSRASMSNSGTATTTSSAAAQTSSGGSNAAAAAFSPSTAGLSVLALAGAILPFL